MLKYNKLFFFVAIYMVVQIDNVLIDEESASTRPWHL